MVGARGVTGQSDLPPLVDKRLTKRFDIGLFSDPGHFDLLELQFAPDEPRGESAETSDPRTEAWLAVQAGDYDAAVYFPPDFGDRMEQFKQANLERLERAKEARADSGAAEFGAPTQGPTPEIIFTTANEKSQIAFARLFEVLQNWRQESRIRLIARNDRSTLMVLADILFS